MVLLLLEVEEKLYDLLLFRWKMYINEFITVYQRIFHCFFFLFGSVLNNACEIILKFFLK